MSEEGCSSSAGDSLRIQRAVESYLEAHADALTRLNLYRLGFPGRLRVEDVFPITKDRLKNIKWLANELDEVAHIALSIVRDHPYLAHQSVFRSKLDLTDLGRRTLMSIKVSIADNLFDLFANGVNTNGKRFTDTVLEADIAARDLLCVLWTNFLTSLHNQGKDVIVDGEPVALVDEVILSGSKGTTHRKEPGWSSTKSGSIPAVDSFRTGRMGRARERRRRGLPPIAATPEQLAVARQFEDKAELSEFLKRPENLWITVSLAAPPLGTDEQVALLRYAIAIHEMVLEWLVPFRPGPHLLTRTTTPVPPELVALQNESPVGIS